MGQRPKTYRVAGSLRVCDTNPGDTFTAVLPEGQEEFLLTVGHIVVVQPPRGNRGADKRRRASQADADTKEP